MSEKASFETNESHGADTSGKGKTSKKTTRRRRVWRGILVVAHLVGAASSVAALMSTRTPQGTVAWAVSLNTIPLVAVPAYWLFGRSRFEGYVDTRRSGNAEIEEALARALSEVRNLRPESDELNASPALDLEHLAPIPFLGGHQVDLLVDGAEAFDHIVEGIGSAQRYVLAEYFIFRADTIGRRVAGALMERAQAGVDAYLLVDAVGSGDLPGPYLDTLRAAGVHVEIFESAQGTRGTRQYQLRNHRKNVVVDGRKGWLGGLNVGDEYLGRNPEWGPWRDTHLALEGPAVLTLQLAFLLDWNWATDETPDFDWSVGDGADPGDETVLVLPTGPADEVESASLMMQHLIHSSDERLWIATPYFVPDAGVFDALEMAALRGVDVRILLPKRSDGFLVHHAAYTYMPKLLELGVEIHRYSEGFMHQKVVLVDDHTASVGTVNLDNRSLRLNFEVTAVVLGADFAGRVESMMARDFERSRRVELSELDDRAWHLDAVARLARLAAPIL